MDFELSEEQKALLKEVGDFYQEMMKDKPPYLRGAYGIDTECVYGEDREVEIRNFYWDKIKPEELKRGFTNPGHPFIGKNLDKNPIGAETVYQISFNVSDLHASCPFHQ